jgi:hypothetical protein
MRRRNRIQSSFDLLLDAICNVFGGILLIAILIAVQVRQTEKQIESPIESASPIEIAKLQKLSSNLAMEIKSAKILLETIRNAIPESSDENKKKLNKRYEELNNLKSKILAQKAELINEYLAINQQIATLEEKIKMMSKLLKKYVTEEETLENEINNLQNDNTLIANNIESTQKNISNLSNQIAQKEKDIKSNKNVRNEALSSPKLHQPRHNKTISLLLRYNRLYQIANRSDFIFHNNEIGTPIPERGIPISKENITKKLQLFDAENFYLTIIVYGDSADQFYIVRDCMVDAGFEYNLIASPDDTIWLLGNADEPQSVQ